MNSAPSPRGIDAPIPRDAKHPKSRYIYFLLAAFDLMTVSAGLYLNHMIMDIYTGSVEVNRVWTDRVTAYSHLGELAEHVNTPGNNVFDSRDVPAEAQRMYDAIEAFDRDLAERRQELVDHLEPAVAAPLLALFDAVDNAKVEMTTEAERIFEYFRSKQPELAGERMATMDHKYAKLNGALLELRSAVGKIQDENFKQQMAAAADLQRFEYLIGLSIMLMVAGAVFYGHRLARQMQADAEEKQRHFTAIEEAEARTRSILDTAADGIFTFDERGGIESFNKAAEAMFGYPSDQAIGRDIRQMIPALVDRLAPPAPEAAPVPPVAIAGGEFIGRRQDGTEFPLELSTSRVSLGRAPVYTGIARDVTDRRRAEEAMRIATAAQEASRAKSQFLANMSHEIRTPMNGILGMAEMLLDTRLTAKQRNFAEVVHRSGESLLRIIDDILDLSKIEAGKLEIEEINFKPRDLVDEVVELTAEWADKKELELVSRIAADVPPVVRGASSRLSQVLTNLVGNAIKFTDHGRVLIEVAMQTGSDGRTPLLGFTVRDTGIGILPSVQERLFTAFTQADNSTTRRYGGTGLGLAISKELVTRMGGQIGLRSQPGQGSEFWFTVPVDRPQPAEAAKPKLAARESRPPRKAGDARRKADGSLNGIRILLAEDNPINQDVTRTMLESLRCEVSIVDNGAQALAALEQAAFDIVLMDCQMPEMDGFATVAAIRSHGWRRPRQPAGDRPAVRLPVVALTASAIRGDREHCLAAGMDDYLAKPFRRETLQRVIEKWVLDQEWGLDQALPEPEESAEEPPSPPDTLDRNMLDQIRNNRPESTDPLGGLIDRFIADAAEKITTLRQAADLADADALARTAHSLTSGSAFLGARKLAGLCRDLERTARAGSLDGVVQRIDTVQAEYAEVCQALNAMR